MLVNLKIIPILRVISKDYGDTTAVKYDCKIQCV